MDATVGEETAGDRCRKKKVRISEPFLYLWGDKNLTTMKKLISVVCVGMLLGGLGGILTACEGGIFGDNDPKAFYYYGIEDRKIYLDLVHNQVYVEFVSDASEEQIRSVANDYPDLMFERRIFSSDRLITSGVVRSIRARDKVVSAEYLFETEGSLMSITDEFTVLLKPETSYSELQALAQRYDCRIGEENEFVDNQYMLYASKASGYNSLRLANIFYETRLFEFAEPNFIWLNAEINSEGH